MVSSSALFGVVAGGLIAFFFLAYILSYCCRHKDDDDDSDLAEDVEQHWELKSQEDISRDDHFVQATSLTHPAEPPRLDTAAPGTSSRPDSSMLDFLAVSNQEAPPRYQSLKRVHLQKTMTM